MGKRLTDLYVTGKECSFGPGEDPIKVWIQKLNPVEHDRAMTKSQAARSRVLASKNDPESDVIASINSEILDKDLDWLVAFLVQEEVMNMRAAVEARVAEENGWDKDNYLQGLQDAWEGLDDTPGLKEAYARGEEDEGYAEAKRTLDELTRYQTEVTTVLESASGDAEFRFRNYTVERLQQVVLEKSIKIEADMAWLREFRRCQVWLAVRDPENHKNLYFRGREEVDELQQEALNDLLAAYENLEVGILEGKELEEVRLSSTSSEPQKDQSEPSGPEDVAA